MWHVFIKEDILFRFAQMAAIYIIQLEDLPDVESVKDAVAKYCKEIVEDERTISFVPKDGFLATLGLFFTEKMISYQLEFKRNFQ